MRSALARLVDAHRRTLDALSTGVAMFDSGQKLTFYNAPYAALWNIDAWKESSPSMSGYRGRWSTPVAAMTTSTTS